MPKTVTKRPPLLQDATQEQIAALLRHLQLTEGGALDRAQEASIDASLAGLPRTGPGALREQAATDFLLVYGRLLRDLAGATVAPLSPAQWLWYLRRAPSNLIGGQVPSTEGYVRMLAEVISADSPTSAHMEPQLEHGFSLEVSKVQVRQMLILLMWCKRLANVHSLIRWCGKGGAIEVDSAGRPQWIHDAQLRRLVNLYDRRAVESGGALGPIGTATPSDRERQLGDLALFTVARGGELEVQLPEPERRVRVQPRYAPLHLPVDRIAGLVDNLELSGDSTRRRQLVCTMLVLQVATDVNNSLAVGSLDLWQRGYLVEPTELLESQLEEALPKLRRVLEETTLVQDLPEAGVYAFATANWHAGSAFPLMPSAPVRDMGGVALVDAFAAAWAFRRMLTYTADTGEVANVRGLHFERALQAVIDTTRSSPTGAARALVGRVVRRGGRHLTDVDCVALRGRHIVLINCKSKRYDDEIEGGNWRAVSTLRLFLEGAAGSWQAKVADIVEHEDLLELRDFDRVSAVVCTPFVPYLEDPRALRSWARGLRPVMSAGEVESWCHR